jgi:hypothetical protein
VRFVASLRHDALQTKLSGVLEYLTGQLANEAGPGQSAEVSSVRRDAELPIRFLSRGVVRPLAVCLWGLLAPGGSMRRKRIARLFRLFC